jgi:hypothetical protein
LPFKCNLQRYNEASVAKLREELAAAVADAETNGKGAGTAEASEAAEGRLEELREAHTKVGLYTFNAVDP